MADRQGIYSSILQEIFLSKFSEGATEVEFERADIQRVADQLGVAAPKNLGDLVYSFRYRAELPSRIQERASEGEIWIIRPAGRSRYKFVRVPAVLINPNRLLIAVKVPDATPGIVAKYAFNDEQAYWPRFAITVWWIYSRELPAIRFKITSVPLYRSWVR